VAQEAHRCSPCVLERHLAGVVAGEPCVVEQALQGTLHLERRPLHELQARLLLRARRRVLEQELHQPEHAEERVGDVVSDVGGELTERRGSGERISWRSAAAR